MHTYCIIFVLYIIRAGFPRIMQPCSHLMTMRMPEGRRTQAHVHLHILMTALTFDCRSLMHSHPWAGRRAHERAPRSGSGIARASTLSAARSGPEGASSALLRVDLQRWWVWSWKSRESEKRFTDGLEGRSVMCVLGPPGPALRRFVRFLFTLYM